MSLEIEYMSKNLDFFLSFGRNTGTNTGKDLIDKYSKKCFDLTKKQQMRLKLLQKEHSKNSWNNWWFNREKITDKTAKTTSTKSRKLVMLTQTIIQFK